jgi:hypothetical protein
MREKRRCEFCGKPLPPDSAPNRRFHEPCRKRKYFDKLLAEAGRKKSAA